MIEMTGKPAPPCAMAAAAALTSHFPIAWTSTAMPMPMRRRVSVSPCICSSGAEKNMKGTTKAGMPNLKLFPLAAAAQTAASGSVILVKISSAKRICFCPNLNGVAPETNAAATIARVPAHRPASVASAVPPRSRNCGA